MTIVSVICEVAWGDRVVTRMTVWSDMPDGFGIGRALILATYAYESRMRRPPPEIELNLSVSACRTSSRCATTRWTERRTSWKATKICT